MPPTAEILQGLKPPPEVGQITRFCDDLLRHRRPQRLVLVKQMPLQSVQMGTQPLQLMGAYGPIPEAEVSVWPTLFKAQDIEVTNVEHFLVWLKRMQTSEIHWLFASPEMTYPSRSLVPFLEEEAPAWEGARELAAQQPPVQPSAQQSPVQQPAVQPTVKGVVEEQLSTAAPARPRVADKAVESVVPAKRPPAHDGGFVPTGEEAEQMRRSLAMRRHAREPFRPIMEQGWGEGPVPMLQAAGGPARPSLPGAKVTWGSQVATPREMTYLAPAPEPLPVTGSPPIPYSNAGPAAAGGVLSRGLPYAVPLAILGGMAPAFAGGMTMGAAGGQLTLARVPSPFGGSIPVPYLHLAGAGQPGTPAAGQPQTALPSQAAWGAPSVNGRYYPGTPQPVTGSMPVPYPTSGTAIVGTPSTGGFPYAIPLAVTGGFAPTGARPMMFTPTGSWVTYLRTPSAGGPIPVPYLQLPINAAGFMAGRQRHPGEIQQPPLAPGSLLTNPYLGQMTLIAPPLRVASEEAEDRGTAVAFHWESLMKGQRPLDPRALSALRQTLPEGSQLIYPALPKGQLPAGAVNLRLAQPTVAHLLATGYGVPPAAGVASRVMGEMEASLGASPAPVPLAGLIVPGKRPTGTKASLLPAGRQPGGALPRLGSRESHRDGELGFLGMPVSLAPSLGGRSDVRDAITSGVARDKVGKTVRPPVFNALRHLLFPSFQSVEAEPDQRAWHKAAPSFGLPDSKPTTVLAPHARMPIHTPTTSLPQLDGAHPSTPGALPQLHVADASPFQPAARATGSMPAPVLGFSPFSAHESPLPPMSDVLPGGPSTGGFRPIVRPTIGPALPDLLPGAPPPPPRSRRFGGLPAAIGAHAALPGAGFPAPIGRPAVAPLHLHHPPVIGPGSGENAGRPTPLPRPPALPVPGSLGQHLGGPPPPPPSGLPSIFQPRPPRVPYVAIPAGGNAGSPMPDMQLPFTPPLLQPGGGTRTLTTLVSRAPQMLFTPPAPRTRGHSPLAIQRSIAIESMETTVQQPGQPRSAEQMATRSEREGMHASEINMLATEVWSLLKQRLATEAIRRGRW
ncbi:MAG: hypothetical protein ACYDCO_00615 [Armatimonadota bacterium]